jgi:hypothetical protein
MNIDAVAVDLNNHIEEIKSFKFHTPSSFKREQYSWGGYNEICLCSEYTNLNHISLAIKQKINAEEFTVICNVTATSAYYDEFKRLSSAKTYTEYSYEDILRWFRYVKEIKRVMCQTEDHVQKLLGSAVRKGIIFKDDLE